MAKVDRGFAYVQAPLSEAEPPDPVEDDPEELSRRLSERGRIMLPNSPLFDEVERSVDPSWLDDPEALRCDGYYPITLRCGSTEHAFYVKRRWYVWQLMRAVGLRLGGSTWSVLLYRDGRRVAPFLANGGGHRELGAKPSDELSYVRVARPSTLTVVVLWESPEDSACEGAFVLRGLDPHAVAGDALTRARAMALDAGDGVRATDHLRILAQDGEPLSEDSALPHVPVSLLRAVFDPEWRRLRDSSRPGSTRAVESTRVERPWLATKKRKRAAGDPGRLEPSMVLRGTGDDRPEPSLVL